ncbi:hypothetical protein B9Z19DRAFT_1133364 [Tuber borchii]|uniref:Uncharacterized protein n=1 Tax=Tuber borchii TaxID=42251 RepID=A0A2T6ZFZ3_TUBBO|nr:hypothetical protein B9Z19DRAFT_1133364 [Tuber borchii]
MCLAIHYLRKASKGLRNQPSGAVLLAQTARFKLTEWGLKTPGWTFWSDLFLKTCLLQNELSITCTISSIYFAFLEAILVVITAERVCFELGRYAIVRLCDCNAVKNAPLA